MTRHGDIDVASIRSRLSSPPISCCGNRSLATVTNGERALRPPNRHVLDGHLVKASGELDLDVELVRPLLKLGHERGPEHLLRRVHVERATNHAVGEFLDRRDAKLGDIVAMPHSPHRP